MTDNLSLEEMMPVIEEKLSEGGEVTFTVTGNSMLPMLHNRQDTVTLVTPTFPLKKYDLPFYRRAGGLYTLHRIVKIKKGNYIIRGDNCNFTEYGIEDKDIIGVVKQFTRNGKQHSVVEKSYKIYCALWCNDACYFLRKRVLFNLRRVASKIKWGILKRG